MPTVRWQVDEGVHQVGDDGPVVKVADKHVMFEDPSNTIEIRNAATPLSSSGEEDSVYRQVWFEIKGDKPKFTEQEVQEKLKNAIYTTDVGTSLLFENKWCRVWDFYLEPGEGDPNHAHHHCLDYVFVYVAKGRLLGYSHDGQPGLFDSVNEDCDVTYNDIPDDAYLDVNHAHGGKNGYDDIPMREYLVELK